jgi:hypothetical protein
MNVPTGFIWKDWRRLLKEVGYQVDKKYLSRAVQVTVLSLLNSRYINKELQLFKRKYEQSTISQPVFILGHWRNGTTLLHELMGLDPQFAYPNLFEISRPHTFLYREPFIERLEANPDLEKRPMDNMQVNFRSPGEDESGLAVLCLRSSTISWMFPRHEDRYDRYLTFRGVSSGELDQWKAAITLFMKKLTLRYQRPLLMKSPSHTAKVKILLDLFPDARFIHIHRNPFTVYQSTIKLYHTAVRGSYLQDPIAGSVESGVVRRYRAMYEAYFEDKTLIPADRLVEIGFSDLDKDKLGTLRRVYEHLGLTGFDQALPAFQAYLNRTQDYQKNKYQPMPDQQRQLIAKEWQRCFEEWGYPTQ